METLFKQWDMKAQKFCSWLLVAAENTSEARKRNQRKLTSMSIARQKDHD